MKTKLLLLFIVIFILATLLFTGAINRPPELWDEATNIAVVDESLDSENPILLSLNGELFYEKPPLWYWLTMPLVKLSLPGYLSYRLISILSAIGIFTLLYKLINRRTNAINSVVALFCVALILPLFYINPLGYFDSHTFNTADLDALQIFFIIASVYPLLIDDVISKKKMLLSFTFLGFGLLTKGPFVLIPLLLNIFILLRRKFNIRELILGIILFASPFLCWFITMYVVSGNSFIDEFLNYHILLRGLTTLEEHFEPIWFYIQIFLNPLLNLLVVLFVVKLVVMKVKHIKFNNIELYSFFFICSTLLLFTLIATKLAWYIMPVYVFELFFIFGRSVEINLELVS